MAARDRSNDLGHDDRGPGVTSAATIPGPRPIAPGTGHAIVVLGGYGAVGRAVSQTLATLLPGRVVVAGRDGGKAADFAATLPGDVQARRIDVGQVEHWGAALE